MKPIPARTLFWLGFLGLSAALSGAEFRALSWENALDRVTYSGRAAGSPLTISAGALGNWEKIIPSADGVEFQILPPPAPADSSKPAPASVRSAPLAKVFWPAGLERALLLFVPAPAGSPTPYSIILIPERSADTTPPALRVFNHSDRDIALRIGAQPPAKLPPLASFDSDDRPASGAQTITIAYTEETLWRIAADTSLALPPGFSAYVFIRGLPVFDLEPNSPRVGYKIIYDRLPPPSSGPAR